MELKKNIAHTFDLSGMRTGDSFLGCTKCWSQMTTGSACYPECPTCGIRLSLLYVRVEDIKLTNRVRLDKGDWLTAPLEQGYIKLIKPEGGS